ncbi:MAG TPA: ubiquinol-cytochrome c reductase iron-sulfur subunit [Rhodanobacteraceae bacterium]
MTDEVVDHGRRRFLTATTAVVGIGGLGTAIAPFIKSWQPSARAQAVGAPVTVDVSKIAVGQQVTVGWRNMPISVIHRTPAQIATLTGKDVEARLKDPHCNAVNQQPPFAKNAHRSIKPEWLVMIRICTHLGCIPDYEPKIGPEPFDPNWESGFFCPCHHSRYDIAGRVYDGSPAPLNMPIPPYHFVDAEHVEIGVMPEGAKPWSLGSATL